MPGSNQRPPACRAGALPTELMNHIISIANNDDKSMGLNLKTEMLVGFNYDKM